MAQEEMAQEAKRLIKFAVSPVSAVVVLFVAINAGMAGMAGPLWPKKQGVWIAASSAGIPAFPRALTGFRSEKDKDFWGKPFVCTGSIRIFEGHDWEAIPDFPATMNACGEGMFMIRWRTSNRDTRIASNLGSADLKVGTNDNPKVGSFGYMYGTNCDQPAFKFASSSSGSGLVDVFYEIKFWQGAP